MKARPIIFSGEMVRAILDGRKTQTRRLIKPQPIIIVPEITPIAWNWNDKIETYEPLFQVYMADICPYGIPGDQLWVRENIRKRVINEYAGSTYLSDLTAVMGTGPNGSYVGRAVGWPWKRNVLPSIYMPRWASRIYLEITNIRVERLQDISGQDAIQEGYPRDRELFPTINTETKAVAWFKQLWDSINTKRGYPWENNPWVWIIEFRKLEIKNNA